MNKTEMALASFRKPYSCAQTVYAAFAEQIDPQKMDEMKLNSAGRAPDGICGALYAAISLRPECADEFKAKFSQLAGDTRCREIKTVHKTPCEECVKIAASLLIL